MYMTELKICNRCGKKQPIDEFYMVKYKNKPAEYRHSICKTCTSIEQKRRYLEQVDPENPLLEKIQKLYDKYGAAGRSVPNTQRRRGTEIEDTIDKLLEEDI